MEMTQDLKNGSQHLVQMFLQTMPEEDMKRYKSKKLHHQLSYFYCWAEIMRCEHES